MNYRVAHAMHLGERANQEDCLFVNGEVVQENETPEVRRREIGGEAVLFAVCDGMGGHAQGERASRLVCESLRDALPEIPAAAADVEALLARVQDRMVDELSCSCGTTVAGVAVRGTRALVFSAGDSRVYRVSPGAIERLTRDHSYVQGCVDRGEIAEEEAFSHPYRNVIEFGLGDIFAATWEQREREVFVAEHRLAPGDALLLCSDGLHDALRDSELRGALGASPFEGVAGFPSRLRGIVRDNTSYILVEPVFARHAD